MKKNNLRQFMIKLWALTLAIIMAFPFNAFASSQIKEDTKSYDDKSSIMGLVEDNEEASEENINSINSKQDYSKNIEDRGKYSIEKKASLSKDSSKLIYTIELTNKDFTKEEAQGDISLALGFDTSSNIKNIEVKNIEGYKDEGSLENIQANSQKNSSLDPLQTLTVTSKNYEKLLYTIEADISSVDDKATYSLIMSLNKDDENIYLSTYDLRTDIINVTENNTQKELVELVDISEDNNSYLDAFYKEDKELIWQDYLVNDKEDSRKVRYDLNSDNNQDFTNSKINLEYLSLGKDGFEKNEELSQSLDYVKNLEFDIPKGYIVKLSLKSQIDKDNTSIKNYSMNNRTIKNPYYKEDKESSDDSDDESAQQDIDENKNLSKKDATDAKNKVTVKADPDSNEFVIDEPIFEKEDKSSVNATESQSSAIDLNKDSILNKYKSKGNLSPVLEVTINNITSLLKSYNDDKISYEDFENKLSSQTNDISKQEFTEITSTLIEGLNEEKYKVAKIDIDSLANQVYSDGNIDKQSSKSLDKVDTSSQNDNTNKKSQEIPLSSEEIAKQDAVESFDSYLRKAAEEAKKPQEDDRTLMSDITEGVKGIFGQSNLDKADKELKEALDNDISLEKLQDLLLDLGERYDLNSKDEAKLMSDNEEAIKAVIAKDADNNFRPSMLLVQNESGLSEKGLDDVDQVVDLSNAPYNFDMKVFGVPVIENGQIEGINWTIRIASDKDLKDYLGMKLNLTTVKGSGLGEIQNVKINNNPVELTDQLDSATGIVDSKHHNVSESTKNLLYTFYTPKTNIQGSYMLDLSVIFTKQDNKKGALRSIVDQGYPQEKVEEATPTRVGMNNRTTIQGRFLDNANAEWTITDGVSTGDTNKGLPLESRNLDANQTIKSGKRVVYGIDDSTGKMIAKVSEKSINSIPIKSSDPSSSQDVGSIGVYEFQTKLNNPDQAADYSLSGVKISKYRDLYIDQNWNLPEGQNMPAQTIKVLDNNNNELAKVDVKAESGKQRNIVIPNVKYWDIDNSGKAKLIGHKIVQTFPENKLLIGGKEYKYYENANYYRNNPTDYYIHNSLNESTDKKSASFVITKVDSKNPDKTISGARFKLFGANVELITDSKGEAVFRNIAPGTYSLIETKAPDGYKLDQNEKQVTITDQGEVSVSGANANLTQGSGKTEIVEHSGYPNWPDYMNSMHYGKLDNNGNLEFYIFLKPYAQRKGGSTDKNTRLDISLPGVDLTNAEVTAYDVSPSQRASIKSAMESQTMDQKSLGSNVINAANNNKITGEANFTDPYTGRTGYKIYFPVERFGNDWGFLVKVKANIGQAKDFTNISYDWLANDNAAGNDKIQEIVKISKNPQENGPPTITVANDPFEKSPITVTKFADSFTSDKRDRLAGAEFVLKDSNDNVISNKFTDENGELDFGKFPPGTYYIEESSAPEGYEKSNVYFEVTVDESGEVRYQAKFKNKLGIPTLGEDYYIEHDEESSSATNTEVLEVHQHMSVEDSSRGQYPGVWEAYQLESLNYKLDARLNIAGPGSRFEIQFDRNLDFTQYFTGFPKIEKGGKIIAEPYFDNNSNLLTYVFNENAAKGETTISMDLKGIIPSKYYVKTHQEFELTNIVAPSDTITDPSSNQKETVKLWSYYDVYDAKRDWSGKPTGTLPSQTYYFRDVYQKDGQWYVAAIAYYNPLANYYGSSKTLLFNWMSTNYQQASQHEWNANGNLPAFTLDDVNVYRVNKNLTNVKTHKGTSEQVNPDMPLSMGIKPDQNPNIYERVFHTTIDPASYKKESSNSVELVYNPSEIKTNAILSGQSPLQIKMPSISSQREGYVIEQIFKIPDIDKFKSKWRAFYMADSDLKSTFIAGPRSNTVRADQVDKEIPKFYREEVGIINKKYTPGKFKIIKTDESTGKLLPGVTFALTDSDGSSIYRTSNDNGEVDFTNLLPGQYTLKETKAAEGFKLSDEKWQVTVYSDGNVRITETSVLDYGDSYQGKDISLDVTNKPASNQFAIYKKDAEDNPLADAKFRISKQNSDPKFEREAVSDQNGIVKLKEALADGTYIIEEIEAPAGYKKLDNKWVLVVDKGKNKIYNYVDPANALEVKSIPAEDGVYWVDVKNRDTTGWSQYDSRWTGWTRYSNYAYHLGTRIVAINKDKKYVVQRYVINPESIDRTESTAIISREPSQDPNMDWYKGTEDYKVFSLDKPVTGLISDIRLGNYDITDITKDVKSEVISNDQGPNSLKMTFPETNKPIIVDIKVPYKDEAGAVGTRMDLLEGGDEYNKSDYYERVSDIKLSEPTHTEEGNIKGSYISDDSLDVINELQKYEFRIKKVKEGSANQVIQGASFKLTGPDESTEERYMTTEQDGIISFNDLEPGTYKLEETEAAPGYAKSDTTWTVMIGDDGKTYIKEDKPVVANRKVEVKEDTAAQNIEELAISRFSMANISFMAVNQNLGLEESPIAIASPQMAASGWQKVDPAMSKTSSKSDSANGEIKTKITEINKDTKQFKQVFLIDGSKSTLSPIILNIHRVGLAEIKPTDISVSVYPVSKDSTVDNLTSIGGPIKYNGPFGDNNFPGVTLNFVKQNQNIAIEVTSSYSTGSPIGLEMYYHYSRSGSPANWKHFDAKESYANENDVNKIESYKVNINQPQNGTIDADKKTDLKKDDTVRLTKQANDGYIFKEWNVRDAQGNPVTVSNDQFRMPASDVTVSAVFEKIPSYQVWVQTVEGGKVTPNPNKDVTAGTTINLTIEPEDGYELEKITYNDLGGKTYEVNGTSFEMPNHNVTLMPTFKKKPVAKYNITLMQVEGGNISADPMSAEKGTIIKLTASADEGYEFEGFTVTDEKGQTVEVNNDQFTMPASNVTVSAKFNKKKDETPQPPDGFTEILKDGFAEIPNKQVGLDFRVFKEDSLARPLKGAEFSIKKYTGNDYKSVDNSFKEARGISDENGLVEFTASDGNKINLPEGYYQLIEDKSPSGYKQAQAPWKIRIYEENGQLKAEYIGPEDTTVSFINSDKANDKEEITTVDGIKYKSRLTYINTESKSYVQRVYIDTRNYNGQEDKLNVQINPIIKREEIDTPGQPPVTIKEGLKTSFRSTYKISGAAENPDVDSILRYYDLSNNDVSMVNTARWRPFDWGFDEDLLNLGRGVYYIDIEGYYDDNIIKEGQIATNIDFYPGERKFQQAIGKDDSGKIIYNEEDGGSYQLGNEKIGLGPATAAGQEKAGKYSRWLGKEGGRIYPSLDGANKSRITTSIDISSLYSSNKTNQIPERGMTIENDEESYNITFSKHGRNNPNEDINGEEVTNRRLEGAIFKLQQQVGPSYEDVPGSYIGSAFNGYFGFRSLKPGRYRLMEVRAPEGYIPIKEPLLYFTVETITTNSGNIINPKTGESIDVKTIDIKFPGNDKKYSIDTLEMLDPKTGNPVSIKDIDSKDINLLEMQIINPETKQAMDSSTLKIVVDEDDFDIKDIKIVPNSNGLISLEYDKANGVYQYVPEKTTSEKDGKLVDFVTSATAKNMGKIINEKPENGKLNVKKVDQKGNSLAGAKFKLINISTGKVIGLDGNPIEGQSNSVTVDDKGNLNFTNLEIGNYRLEETKSPDGYINTDQEWNFTIGGPGLDPYSGDVNTTGKDISDKVTLKSDMTLLKPDGSKNEDNNTVKPNQRESLLFTNDFKVGDVKVNPGDYFILKLSDNIDLNGVIESNPPVLDIIESGVGTIAKANYNSSEGTITYTFTDYAKNHQMEEFSGKLRAFINTDEVKDTSDQSVGLSIGENTAYNKNVKVDYDLDMDRIDDGENFLNLASKIVSYNADSGEFVHYYYINRDKQKSGLFDFIYSPYQDIEAVNIERFKLNDNSNVEKDMPASFAVDESSDNLVDKTTLISRNSVKARETLKVSFDEPVTSEDSYIIKVSGRVAGDNKSAYSGYGRLVKPFDNKEDLYVERDDEVYAFTDKDSAEKYITINAVNPSNMIKFKKVDTEGKPLENAEFKLEIKSGETWTSARDTNIKTTDTGLIELKSLKPGEYKLTETKAPDGYKMADNPVAEFTVKESGEIYRKENNNNLKEPGIIPNLIVNKKKQEIELVKVDASDDQITLQGAEFEVLYTSGDKGEYSNNDIKLYENEEGDKLVLKAGESVPDGYTEQKAFSSDKDGKVKFTLYEPGYYAIKETKAPSGYIKDKDVVKEFAIIGDQLATKDDDGYKFNNEVSTNNPIKVTNKKSEFPLTGGKGVWIGFAIIGTLLMLIAIAYYSKYQKNNNLKSSDS